MADKVAEAKAAAKAQLLKLLEDDQLDVHALSEALMVRSRITVTNKDGGTVWVKVSKACGAGQDGYWGIPPGGSEKWMRCVYHRVTIKASNIDHDDAGIFASVDHTTAVSTNCNDYWIEGGRFVYKGSPDCL